VAVKQKYYPIKNGGTAAIQKQNIKLRERRRREGKNVETWSEQPAKKGA